MADVVDKNGRVELSGNVTKRFGNILKAQHKDEVVILAQLQDFLGGEYVTSNGAFVNVDPDHAIKIQTPNGAVYLPVLLYP